MADFEVPQPQPALKFGLNVTAGFLHWLGPQRYRVADALANAAFALQPGRRRATISNYRMVFPQLDHREARRLAAHSFREYGRTSIDFVYVHRLPRPRLMSSFRGFGVNPVRLMQAEGKGGILVLIHIGAWDAGGAWATAMGVPLTAVMADEGSRALQDLVVWARAEIGMRAVPASRSARVLLQTLRSGRWLALLADIPGDTPAVEVEFLGRRTQFSSAPALLAGRTGCPLVAVVAVRSPAGGYLVEVHEPQYVDRHQDPADALRPLLDIFERAVRRWPEQWYPFEEGRLLGSS